ncbi:MAG: DUF1439 domain-containing protein [Thermodesulfobacteriota bacterium]
MRRSVKLLRVAFGLALLLAGGLAVWFLFAREPEIVLTATQIQAAIEKKFPIVKRHFEIIEVTYSDPAVILEEGSDRIRFGLNAATSLRSPKIDLRGTAVASARVAYDKSSAAFFLEDPLIEKITIDGLSEKWTKIAAEMGTLGVRKYLNQHPVYKLNPDKYKQNLVKYILKDVKVRDGKLVLTLGL